jgi:hypothetical protein
MTLQSVALIGRARSGKDTAAAHLVSTLHYVPVAFASPLKTAAEQLDPIVSFEPTGFGPIPVRLTDALRRWGWEEAKDRYPEVRRCLQHMGQTVRDLEPDFWLNIALSRVTEAQKWNIPVVVTDCRYPNEAEALKARGFTTVRIVRPSVRAGLAGEHESETALDQYVTDYVVSNRGTVAELHDAILSMVRPPF